MRISLHQELHGSFGNLCFVVQGLDLEMFLFCSESGTFVLNYIFSTAHKKLAESFTEEQFTGDMRILEAHWFRKVGRLHSQNLN